MSRLKRINRKLFDSTAVRPLGRFIYRVQRDRQTVAQSTATQFFRNLHQLAAFEGPLNYLVKQPFLRVLVTGCSVGCEAFTIGAYLAERFPSLKWHIDASDISEQALAIAKAGVYGPEHGVGRALPELAAAMERRLLERDGNQARVREAIRDRVVFNRADVLAEDFPSQTEYDAVFGQNFMIHMSPANEERAFSNLVTAARVGGALFLGGMDLDRRPNLVLAYGLTPVDWNLTAIHDDDEMRRSAWPWHYWALEPIKYDAAPFLERYSTIFVKARKAS